MVVFFQPVIRFRSTRSILESPGDSDALKVVKPSTWPQLKGTYPLISIENIIFSIDVLNFQGLED